MPKYFFHIHDGESVFLDQEGMEFDTLEMAFQEARASIRDLAIDHIRACGKLGTQRIEIANAKGRRVGMVPVAIVIR